MNKAIKPLYRKVNTKARGVFHHFGSDYKHIRNTNKDDKRTRGSMYSKSERGLDYTPLYMFLLSKVGSNWNNVFSEAKSRLDKVEPIYYLVAKAHESLNDYIRCGENSYFNGLFVDENNNLQKVNPNVKISDLPKNCTCCTHTFNGKVY